eukprot:275254_1
MNPIADIIHESKRKKSPKKASPDHLRSNTDWMKQYSQKRLTDLWIPGSNGSATYSIHKSNDHIFGGNWNKTQRLTISEQLTAGIRFLHVRLITKSITKKCANSRSYLTTFDTYISNRHKGDLLGTILTQITEFVDHHPTEIVILRIERDVNYHKRSINNAFQFLPAFKKLVEVCGDRLVSRHNDGINRTSQSIYELTHNGTKGRIVLVCQSSLQLKSSLMDSYGGWRSVPGEGTNNICNSPSKFYEYATEFWCHYEHDFGFEDWDFIVMSGHCEVSKGCVQKYVTGQFGGALKALMSVFGGEQFENHYDYACAINYQLYMFLKTRNFEEKK